jgi:hypothetical protein
VTDTSHRTRLARRLAVSDPGGLLYGAIVSAAVLVTISAHAEGKKFVAIATACVLVVYWLAHVYIETLSTQFRGDARGFLRRLASACRHEVSVLEGGVPAIVVYVLAYTLFDASVSGSAVVAAWFSTALMVVIGYLGAHHAGIRGWPMLIEVCAAGSFGLLIVLGKTLLH